MRFLLLLFLLIPCALLSQSELPKKDKVKASNYEEMALIEDLVYKVKKNDQWAIIDFEENILIDFDSLEIQYFEPKKLFFKASKIGHGQKVYALDGKSLSDDIIMMSSPKFELQSAYYRVYRYEEEDMKCGLINSQGTAILPTQYDFCSTYYNDLLLIINNDSACLLNLNLDTIASGYNFIGELNHGLISVGTFDRKYGAINVDGVEIIKPKYATPISFAGGAAPASLDGKLFGLIDTLGNQTTKMEYDEIKYLYTCNFQVAKNGLYGLINSQGEEIYPIESTEPITAFYGKDHKLTKNNKVGIVDCNGDLVIPVIYDEIKIIAKHHLKLYCFQVFKNGKTGVLDIKGKELLKVKYDSLSFKSSHTAEVVSDGVSKIVTMIR